jgi:hypothetical protein
MTGSHEFVGRFVILEIKRCFDSRMRRDGLPGHMITLLRAKCRERCRAMIVGRWCTGMGRNVQLRDILEFLAKFARSPQGRSRLGVLGQSRVVKNIGKATGLGCIGRVCFDPYDHKSFRGAGPCSEAVMQPSHADCNSV